MAGKGSAFIPHLSGAPSTGSASLNQMFRSSRTGLGAPNAARYFAASAASMAAVASGESGVILEVKRLMIFPSLPMRNLLKFQVMLPGNGEAAPASAM